MAGKSIPAGFRLESHPPTCGDRPSPIGSSSSISLPSAGFLPTRSIRQNPAKVRVASHTVRRVSRTLSAAIGGVALLVWVVLTSERAAAIGTDLLLRSTRDLGALRELLSDSERWAVLRRLTSRYALQSITTQDAESDAPPGTVLQVLTLRGRDTGSKRLYRQTYRVRSSDGEASTIEALPGSYGTAMLDDDSRPACEGTSELAAFRAVLLDPGSDENPGGYSVLADCLAHHALTGFSVLRTHADPGAPPAVTSFEVRFFLDEEAELGRVGDGGGESARAPRFLVRYDVEHDVALTVERLSDAD
jgi:hypothetical protein